MPEFSPSEAAVLLCVTRQAIAKACSEGRIKSHNAKGNGGDQYRIALTDLPEPAQVRYWVAQLKAVPQTDRRDFMHTQPIPDALVRKVAQAAPAPFRKGLTWTTDAPSHPKKSAAGRLRATASRCSPMKCRAF